MTERKHPAVSGIRQCQLLSIFRSHICALVRGESTENLALMRLIDAQFLMMARYGKPEILNTGQGRPFTSPRSPRS